MIHYYWCFFLTGIVSYGIYLPNRIVDSRLASKQSGIPQEVIEEKQGWRVKRISEPSEMPSDMGVKAAKIALKRSKDTAGIGTENIDSVIFVGSDFKDYGVWMIATKIQNDLGIKRGFAFDIAAMCVGMVLGLALAKRMTDIAENVLLVATSKESYLVNPKDPSTSWLLDFADGASAMVVSSKYNKNRVLESSFISDGSFYGATVVKSLGAIIFKDERLRASWPYFESLMSKEELKHRLEPVSKRNFVKVIKKALEKSGYSTKDVDLIVLNHMKRSFHKRILDDLGIPVEKSVYLEDFGHVQSSDMVIGLDLGIKKDLVKEGSIIVFASGGTGFLWGATVIRWG